MRRLLTPLVLALTFCSTPVPVHWDVHQQKEPKITVPDPEFEKGDRVAGRRAFIDAGCVDCHHVAEDPALPTAGQQTSLLQGMSRYAPNQLAQRITSVNTGGRSMKQATQPITTKQLVDIVAYLRNAKQ